MKIRNERKITVTEWQGKSCIIKKLLVLYNLCIIFCKERFLPVLLWILDWSSYDGIRGTLNIWWALTTSMVGNFDWHWLWHICQRNWNLKKLKGWNMLFNFYFIVLLKISYILTSYPLPLFPLTFPILLWQPPWVWSKLIKGEK